MATGHWLPVWLASSMPPGTSFLSQTAPKRGDQHCEEGPGLEGPPAGLRETSRGKACGWGGATPVTWGRKPLWRPQPPAKQGRANQTEELRVQVCSEGAQAAFVKGTKATLQASSVPKQRASRPWSLMRGLGGAGPRGRGCTRGPQPWGGACRPAPEGTSDWPPCAWGLPPLPGTDEPPAPALHLPKSQGGRGWGGVVVIVCWSRGQGTLTSSKVFLGRPSS